MSRRQGGLAGDASKGWLELRGFHDFAGSTVVHSVGGWIALAGAIMLGPRIGKYRHDGKANPIPGHNLVVGTLGVFLLWVGWFGFNPGSYTAGIGSIGRVAIGGGFGFLAVQLSGVACTAAWAFGSGMAIFFALKKFGILRVSAKTELKGLDIAEHGEDAYASFQFFSNT